MAREEVKIRVSKDMSQLSRALACGLVGNVESET
jgi:hypothetical protein